MRPKWSRSGKTSVLVGQIGAAGIDQVDARQPVLARDLLGAQVLLDRDRVVGAALDRGVVGDDHALAAHHPADAGDDAGARHLVVVHAVRGELRQLQERRARVEQAPHPLARQQLAARQVALARPLVAALLDPLHHRVQVVDQRTHRRGVRLEGGRPGIDGAGDDSHAFNSGPELRGIGPIRVRSLRGRLHDSNRIAIIPVNATSRCDGATAGA